MNLNVQSSYDFKLTVDLADTLIVEVRSDLRLTKEVKSLFNDLSKLCSFEYEMNDCKKRYNPSGYDTEEIARNLESELCKLGFKVTQERYSLFSGGYRPVGSFWRIFN